MVGKNAYVTFTFQNILFYDYLSLLFITLRCRPLRSSGSVSRNLRADATPKKSLPYWVKEVSKAEKYNPDLEMFEPNDRRYKEENDPDYVLPATDDEIDSEDEGSQDEQEVTLLADEAEKDLPEEVVEGKYK